jgi:spoIIIJ-associated protein
MATSAEPIPSPARPLESYLPAVESLLRELIRAGGFELKVAVRKAAAPDYAGEAPEYVVDFSGPDSDLLLEKHAALLDAFEYVVLKAVRLEEAHFGKIILDCEDWRRLRNEELKLTAEVAAERVIETGDPFTLNPMNPRERRIVHLALKEQPRVRTVSEGFGPERKVVIHPASPPAGKR